MIDISYPKAIELIQGEIDKEGGQHVYRAGRCVNVELKDGKWVGSCLIGRALISAGVTPEEFVECAAVGAALTNIADWGIFKDKVRFTPKAVRLMNMVQYKQDDGVEWSLALANAIESMESPFSEKSEDKF